MRTSYPYYQLSKRYNKDYGTILEIAMRPNYYKDFIKSTLYNDIMSVRTQHQAILDGKRNWLDGYNI